MKKRDIVNNQFSSNMFELKKIHSEYIFDRDIRDYISGYVNIEDPFTIVSSPELMRICPSFNSNIPCINFVNLKRLNDIQYLNSYLGRINNNLPIGGLFICCAETLGERKERILNKYS